MKLSYAKLRTILSSQLPIGAAPRRAILVRFECRNPRFSILEKGCVEFVAPPGTATRTNFRLIADQGKSMEKDGQINEASPRDISMLLETGKSSTGSRNVGIYMIPPYLPPSNYAKVLIRHPSYEHLQSTFDPKHL